MVGCQFWRQTVYQVGDFLNETKVFRQKMFYFSTLSLLRPINFVQSFSYCFTFQMILFIEVPMIDICLKDDYNVDTKCFYVEPFLQVLERRNGDDGMKRAEYGGWGISSLPTSLNLHNATKHLCPIVFCYWNSIFLLTNTVVFSSNRHWTGSKS